MEIKTSLPYKECEYCNAFKPEVRNVLLWEDDRIVGQEAEIYCENAMMCMDIRMAIGGDHTLKDPKKVKKVPGRA